ncbi:putative oligosaccharyl transferase complex, subunit OST3/OST6 [Helianthus annuus]|uniref:Oligosaccharyl transferase complex, subunit OST3/OST6 n=1 Tax=Helianthus annuus TaxID=4232 RepID=A0A251VKG8_HELAN|nr:probable dolichyl-diphosphooligosaccharide--protein glycosyltransferase subunit 3 [Helianthus annuus]KAF5820836.1 putative oligosaccharyl transferase complex, subunit OST3/OST6 [Helianthus annuus]KAJ0610588.1 putative oligosaccharyl transferase complex, subunit OST3/OST6, Thioredoxin-like superfamily [Helianthus annuus]KAJ0621328.1 putative oligosaccharyl transferase complex, subunit OST3/OST6, Thioredoxin-like superfamily [Helianthus annuus]KAJ0625838.1 putative oligosaccharyl transferase c
MSNPPKPPLILLLLLLILTHPTAADPIVSYLHSLRSQSPSGIIHLNQTLTNLIFKPTTRSFHLIIFFDALKLHNQPEPNLKSIKSEFTLVSNSFLINNQNTPSLLKLFFCDVELSESKHNFLRFGVQALPDIRIVPANANDLKSDSIRIHIGDFSGLAESIAESIDLKTGISIGTIHHPPICSKTQFGLIIVGLLIWLPFMTKRIITSNTMFHNKRIWICGTMFVYFFSVSGYMFILIRRIPLFVMDKNDPDGVMFFYKGRAMQFGAEGLCVGFLFTVVGLLLSLVTRIVVRMKDSMMQRLAMVSAMVVSFWAVKQVVRLNHWKTGYAIHTYLPSSWY